MVRVEGQSIVLRVWLDAAAPATAAADGAAAHAAITGSAVSPAVSAAWVVLAAATHVDDVGVLLQLIAAGVVGAVNAVLVLLMSARYNGWSQHHRSRWEQHNDQHKSKQHVQGMKSSK
jgi:TRAP-type C4-dicarboxylate transport system permease large subunit